MIQNIPRTASVAAALLLFAYVQTVRGATGTPSKTVQDVSEPHMQLVAVVPRAPRLKTTDESARTASKYAQSLGRELRHQEKQLIRLLAGNPRLYALLGPGGSLLPDLKAPASVKSSKLLKYGSSHRFASSRQLHVGRA